MNALLSRLLRPSPRARHVQVRVYSREQCCCCHKAIELLRESQARHGFSIEEIDVDSDPALVALHGESVPVVEVGGKVRFRGMVNPVLLERLIRAESRGR